MDAVGTAHLTSDILTQRAVSASVSRSQVTDVLDAPEGAPELVLDLVAAEGGEHATVSMTWSRDDLEKLLESASGDEMVLVFDREELASALGDVEAHGPRARAAVFAVAAAGALGTGASVANAAVLGGDGGGTGTTPVAATSTADESAALQARSEALNQQYSLGATGAAAESAALEARSEALNQQHGLGAAGAESAAVEARSEALNQQYSLGAAGAESAAVEARSEALNQQHGLGAAAESAALEARSEALNQEYALGGSTTESAGGWTLEGANADDALLIGGLLLTIAGATFAVRRTAGGRLA